MNRLKVMGAAVAGALLVGLAIVAVDHLPVAGAPGRAGLATDATPYAGGDQELHANPTTVCAGCTSPQNLGTGATGTVPDNEVLASGEVAADEPGPLQVFAADECCTPALPGTAMAAQAPHADSRGNTVSGMPFGALAMGGAAMRGAGSIAENGGSFPGGETAGTAPGSGTNGTADDVLASISPDTGGRAPANVPDSNYCINPAGIYCGEHPLESEPSNPGKTGPMVLSSVPPDMGPEVQPKDNPLHVSGQDIDPPKELPEPFTLALFGIGLASFRTARRHVR